MRFRWKIHDSQTHTHRRTQMNARKREREEERETAKKKKNQFSSIYAFSIIVDTTNYFFSADMCVDRRRNFAKKGAREGKQTTRPTTRLLNLLVDAINWINFPPTEVDCRCRCCDGFSAPSRGSLSSLCKRLPWLDWIFPRHAHESALVSEFSRRKTSDFSHSLFHSF